MKLASLAALTAAIGLGVSIADRMGEPAASGTSSYRPDCAVAVDGAGWVLPRAGVTIENRRAGPVHAWREPRYGLPRADLGTIPSGESRWLAQSLPAGRNMLRAAAGDGPAIRIVLHVANRGAGNCRRRYLWRIE